MTTMLNKQRFALLPVLVIAVLISLACQGKQAEPSAEQAEAAPPPQLTPMEFAARHLGFYFKEPLDWTAVAEDGGLVLSEGRFELQKQEAVIGVARTKGLMLAFDPRHSPLELARVWTVMRLEPGANIDYQDTTEAATDIALSGEVGKTMEVMGEGWAARVGEFDAWAIDMLIDHYYMGEPREDGTPVLKHSQFKQREVSFFADETLFTLTFRVPEIPKVEGRTFDDLLPEFDSIAKSFVKTEEQEEQKASDQARQLKNPRRLHKGMPQTPSMPPGGGPGGGESSEWHEN